MILDIPASTGALSFASLDRPIIASSSKAHHQMTLKPDGKKHSAQTVSPASISIPRLILFIFFISFRGLSYVTSSHSFGNFCNGAHKSHAFEKARELRVHQQRGSDPSGRKADQWPQQGSKADEGGEGGEEKRGYHPEKPGGSSTADNGGGGDLCELVSNLLSRF